MRSERNCVTMKKKPLVFWSRNRSHGMFVDLLLVVNECEEDGESNCKFFFSWLGMQLRCISVLV